jgi:hypothetical protein
VTSEAGREKAESVLKKIKLDTAFITLTTGGGKNSPGPLKERINFVGNKLQEYL